MTCKHEQFAAKVKVLRIENMGKFVAEVRIGCLQCGVPMKFVGISKGINYNGASVSTDGIEGRFAIVPADDNANVFIMFPPKGAPV